MVVRDDQQHRIAGAHPVAAAFVLQISCAGDGVLEDREGGVAAEATVQMIGGIGTDFIAGASRHGVQPVAAAWQ